MGNRKRCTKRRRRSLRVKIYELKRFIDQRMEKAKEQSAAEELYKVLEKMCDLFDIPRIEDFLAGGNYDQEPHVEKDTNPKSLTREEALDKLREIFPHIGR